MPEGRIKINSIMHISFKKIISPGTNRQGRIILGSPMTKQSCFSMSEKKVDINKITAAKTVPATGPMDIATITEKKIHHFGGSENYCSSSRHS